MGVKKFRLQDNRNNKFSYIAQNWKIIYYSKSKKNFYKLYTKTTVTTKLIEYTTANRLTAIFCILNVSINSNNTLYTIYNFDHKSSVSAFCKIPFNKDIPWFRISGFFFTNKKIKNCYVKPVKKNWVSLIKNYSIFTNILFFLTQNTLYYKTLKHTPYWQEKTYVKWLQLYYFLIASSADITTASLYTDRDIFARLSYNKNYYFSLHFSGILKYYTKIYKN